MQRAEARALLAALGVDEVLLVIGADPLRTDLWTVDEHGLHRRTVTPRPTLFSMIDASTAGVVISAGGLVDGGSGDAVYRLVGDRLLPIAADRTTAGQAPTVSAGGRLAYTAMETAGRCASEAAQGAYSIVVADLEASTSDRSGEAQRLVACSSDYWAPLSWGPDGQLAAIINATTDDAQVAVLDPQGRRRILGPAGRATSLVWGVGNTIGLGQGAQASGTEGIREPAQVIDVATNRRNALPAGWEPLAWSSDGSRMLVSQGARLGLWDLQVRVSDTGLRAPARVWDAAAVG
jgi:hypothetical protein